jgi:hypothetical protein
MPAGSGVGVGLRVGVGEMVGVGDSPSVGVGDSFGTSEARADVVALDVAPGVALAWALPPPPPPTSNRLATTIATRAITGTAMAMALCRYQMRVISS